MKSLSVTFRRSTEALCLGKVRALVDRREVGFLRLWSPSEHVGNRPGVMWNRPGVVIDYVFVQEASRRRGIGTRLYEVAAQYVWRAYGAPLVSDYNLTFASTCFWEKQHRIGRATRIFQRRESRVLPRSFLLRRFVLVTPPPTSLA